MRVVADKELAVVVAKPRFDSEEQSVNPLIQWSAWA
jgi:hypothetical protein